MRGLPAADPRITVFKGIPFAKPPVGELRFAPPERAEKWDGVRDCYAFSPAPVQPPAVEVPARDDLYGKEWAVDPDLPIGEDCLYLNVWTPAKRADERLPVYFWIYGGGWQVGNTAEMEFDGERIARRGIVVVTVNYRVNLFGFSCHRDISAAYPAAPANFGLLDQQAALRWVSRNIAAFGGDADNITIGGQSAGGGSVAFHIENPGSRRYFKRAVIESGVFVNPFRVVFPLATVSEAEAKGEEFFAFCGVSSLEEARKLPARVLQQKWYEWGGFARSSQTWAPVLDGSFVRGDIIDLVGKGDVSLPPLFIGYTGDEFREGGINTVELGIRELLAADWGQGGGARHYVYRFDVPIPGWDNPGTFHSVDLWFFFETLAKCWRPFTGVHYDMARKMCTYLCNFIKTGNPNDGGGSTAGVCYPPVQWEALPEWRPFAFDKPECMVFSTDCTLQSFAAAGEMKKYISTSL